MCPILLIGKTGLSYSSLNGLIITNKKDTRDWSQAVVDDVEAVYEAVGDVIQAFHDDGVVYLELRTTPKAVEGVMTEEDYVEAVVAEIIGGPCDELNFFFCQAS